MSVLSVEVRSGVAVLTLSDPDRRNILSAAMCMALSAAVAEAANDPHVNALLITGAGSAFCAGADLAALEAASKGDDREVLAVYKAFMDVADSVLPTVAVVNGPAVGAGFNLALACDWRIAGARARFDTRFLKLGLHPGGGHGWMLIRAIGWAAASRLLLGGGSADAVEALRIGLVETVAPDDQLLETALASLGDLGRTPRELLLRTKASMRQATKTTHAEAFIHETIEQRWSLGEPAFAAMVARAAAR
ncbi:enoyl-CoA hydratase [Lichenicola cladoniae]|uniref:Enoyl-CoA hydratase n=1 Tax=Lichenicola cladoniae TaxID=1484109 RepID=A0A6M8HPA4_9PROT|nr:enoyl-CoA hydratase [Lichenicola cladoniae]NPD66554.1 enoyl-CoA hydratase [Acetobacteraceae bacterium]QKE90234.1 enoyl-CoA hydratase [Lichenicola cladoniae]